MRTIIYVDGYNLFYGRLRNTQYKWLDIYKLFEGIIKIQNPASSIAQLKYFTAPVKANFASHGQASSASQERYHRALLEISAGRIEIIKGYHTVEKGTPPRYQKPIDKNDKVDVWKFEEKQTDVNIALNMYRDALVGNCEQQVLVSNDSDLEPPLKLISQDLPNIDLGLIIPRSKPSDGRKSRPPNKSLSAHVNWTRNHILDEECQNSQLPDRIPTQRKPIDKPDYW